jgi:hypothetical protein
MMNKTSMGRSMRSHSRQLHRLDVVVAVRLRRDLQEKAIPAHAVVAADLTLLLDAQHLVSGGPA